MAYLRALSKTAACVVLAAGRLAQAQSYLVQFELTPSTYQAKYDELVPQGYGPLIITAHEDILGDPRLQVTWLKDNMRSWSSNVGSTWTDYQVFFDAQVTLGYRPLCVEAYGDYPDEKYASVWIADQLLLPWEARHRMTLPELQAQIDQLSGNGFRVYWISSHGTGTGLDQRFSALWINDSNADCIVLNSDPDSFGQHVQNYRAGGCRLLCATAYDNVQNPLLGGVLSWSEQPPWASFYHQSLTEINATTAEYLSLGYRPTFVSAYESLAGTRFNSAWEEIPETKYWTVTGPEVPELANFDDALHQFMVARHIPNAALAVTKAGRLVLARGYTLARDEWPITQPDSRFRLASLSKTLTAVGVMKLIENGVIELDQPVHTILDTSGWVDSRIEQVTVRHLLQHWGGWDSALSVDPMFNDFEVSEVTNSPLPTTPQMIINYMATQLLDHDPGTQYVYSIFGYCLLGRIIEAVTGQEYDQWTRENVFAPVRAYAPRIAHSLIDQRYEGEPPYVDPYQRTNASVMGSASPAIVPLTDGAWNIHSMDSTGGWICSAVDYARFITAFDDPDNSPLLARPTIDLMWSPPPGTPPDAFWYYAAGWNIDVCGAPGEFCASHSGSLNGTSTFFSRRPDGVNWVILFNSSDIEGLPLLANITEALHGLVDSTTQWPSGDLFPLFGRGDLDCDGAVSVADIPGFALYLTDPESYSLLYQGCVGTRADMNGDGTVDGRDLQPFVDLLLETPTAFKGDIALLGR